MMDYENFLLLVQTMRHHQRMWFKFKCKEDLIKSMQLEREVDEVLYKWHESLHKAKQKGGEA